MADPETIYNWRRLDDRITTSGQPTEPQLADIHALGVRQKTIAAPQLARHVALRFAWRRARLLPSSG